MDAIPVSKNKMMATSTRKTGTLGCRREEGNFMSRDSQEKESKQTI